MCANIGKHNEFFYYEAKKIKMSIANSSIPFRTGINFQFRFIAYILP